MHINQLDLCIAMQSSLCCCTWASCQIRKFPGCACAGNARNISPPPRVSDSDMHLGTCVTHVLWCMPGPLTSSFLWSRWWGKRSRHFRRMRNAQIYVCGKRPVTSVWHTPGHKLRYSGPHPAVSRHPVASEDYFLAWHCFISNADILTITIHSWPLGNMNEILDMRFSKRF